MNRIFRIFRRAGKNSCMGKSYAAKSESKKGRDKTHYCGGGVAALPAFILQIICVIVPIGQ